jgi:hypothetical protein
MRLRVSQQQRWTRAPRALSLRERGLKWREVADRMGYAKALLRCASRAWMGLGEAVPLSSDPETPDPAAGRNVFRRRRKC